MRSGNRAGRTVGILCALILSMTAVLVSSAAAHTFRTASQHELAFSPGEPQDRFNGAVTSKKAKCVRNRRITLFRVVGGPAAPDAAVATATTDSDGAWTAGFNSVTPGDYYAKAAKKAKKRNGHKHICKKAKSNTVVVQAPPPDADGDGWTIGQGDCDDSDGNQHPAATEVENLEDDDCDGQVDEGIDVDGDGFPSYDGDCDDSDPLINPESPERDNNSDDDCDGEVDEGFDVDADGVTPNNGDCDDNNPNVNPAATELDNTIDDDCDGEVDEGFDVDGDGFTPNGGDCNDNDPAINPDATEIGGNFIDEDCDALIDE